MAVTLKSLGGKSLGGRVSILALALSALALPAAASAQDAGVPIHDNEAAGNIGGDGFMLVHDAKTGEQVFFDFRSVAPKAAPLSRMQRRACWLPRGPTWLRALPRESRTPSDSRVSSGTQS